MNSKKRKVEIQDDSSDEFPIREPGKTQAIKLAKSYWQQVPVTQYNLLTFRRVNKELILIQELLRHHWLLLLGKIHMRIKPNLDLDQDLPRGWHIPHWIHSVHGEIKKGNHHHLWVHLVG